MSLKYHVPVYFGLGKLSTVTIYFFLKHVSVTGQIQPLFFTFGNLKYAFEITLSLKMLYIRCSMPVRVGQVKRWVRPRMGPSDSPGQYRVLPQLDLGWPSLPLDVHQYMHVNRCMIRRRHQKLCRKSKTCKHIGQCTCHLSVKKKKCCIQMVKP